MILHVDLDAFFASVEQRDNPALRGKPLIVGGTLPRGVVATASYEARKYGICSGMPLFRAKLLCPGAIFLKGDFVKYEKASHIFLAVCSSYSPTFEQVSLDELYLDMALTEQLYPNVFWVAQKIQERVKKEIGITCSVGISAQKIVAKVASGFNKPSGITEVPVGKEKEFLAPLPLSRLPGCGPKTSKILKDLGIKKTGDFAKMHPEHVRLLSGKHGLDLWKIANGQDPSSVNPPEPAKSISRSTTFPVDTNNKEFIESMLFYLTQKVAQDLRRNRTDGKCISVTIRNTDFQTFSIQRTLSLSITTALEIFKIGKELLPALWDYKTKLRLIGIGVSHLNQMKDKFQFIEIVDWDNKWLKLEQAMDKTRNKYGFLSIMPGSLMKLRNIYLPTEVRPLSRH